MRTTASIAKAELAFAFGAFWRGFWKTTAASGLLLFAVLVYDFISRGDTDYLAVTLGFGLGYCLFLGAHVGLLGGAFNTAWKVAGAWVLVPLVSIPLALVASFWLFGGVLHDQAEAILRAFADSFHDHDYMAAKVGNAARIGPAILLVVLPLLAADLIIVMLDVGVLAELAVFLLLLSLAFLLGFVPSGLVSAIVVGIAYVRGFASRHRQKIRDLVQPPAHGDSS